MSRAEARWNATRAVLSSRRDEPPLLRRPCDEPVPASFAQEGLWLRDRMCPADSAYHLAVAVRLRGPLDVSALEQSLASVWQRHEILRTTFAWDDGRLLQRIGQVPATVLQMQTLSRGDLAGWITARAGEPFDLQRGPLFRPELARISEDDHCLLLSSHHAILDAWSFEILMREWCTRYEMHTSKAPLPTSPAAWQYRDFAAWQRQRMKGERCDELLGYWRAALASEVPVLSLPTDKARRTGLGGRGASRSRVLPTSLAVGLQSLARQERTTLYTVLLAAFNVLLHRYSGDTDIVIGSPVAIRNRPELAEMLGMLINMLPLRTRLADRSTYRTVLAQVSQTVTGALTHQELPFELLVRALGRHGHASSPLFQVMFAYQNVPRSHWHFAGLACEAWNVEPQRAKLDLTLTMQARDDGLSALVSYDADLFDAAMVERMLEHFGRLLEGIVANPDGAVGTLPLLSPAERARVLADGRGPATVCPRSIHRLFEQQAQRWPDSTALVSNEGDCISYRELNQRANRLAWHLVSLGLGQGARVGIHLPRSTAQVAAQLAILKAGAAYVPVEDAPPARLRGMLRTLSALVTDRRIRHDLGWFAGRTIDLGDTDIRDQAVDNLPSDGTPEDLAYVMFTSGSTGDPRGVAVAHRGVVRLVAGAVYARFAPDEVFLQLSPSAFDASTFEVWGALLSGATLVLAPSGPLSVTDIGALVARHQVTTLWLTSGLFELLVEDERLRLASVRQLLTGGDVISARHARRFRERWPDCRLLNCYGPTENTTFSTTHEVGHVEDDGRIPIGRPIANTNVHLLDAHLNPVPWGVVAEAYLGGGGVAQGYLDDPEATRARFLPSPFAAGEILYRTGDRMRRRSDGELEFVGRCDDQIKIRGFRIELTAVEHALRSCPGVRSALVRAEGDTPGRKRLCAFVVTDHDDAECQARLRAALRARLPSYMVPSTITRVELLPLTRNGKRTLPAPVPGAAACREVVAPRNEAERTVAGAFAEVLGLRSVGIYDSFFDIGGDSLAAISVIGALESRTRQTLPLGMLYQNPSVSGLAQAMAQVPAASVVGDANVMTLKAGLGPRPLFLLAGGRGGRPELTICAKLVSRLGPDETVYGLLAPPGACSVEQAAEHHMMTIKRVQPAGPYRLGGECIGGVIAYETAQRLVAAGESVELLLLLDSFCPPGVGELPRMTIRRRLSPRRLLDKSVALLRAGAAFLGELPGRDPNAAAWPLELWRRLTVPREVQQHIEACMRHRLAPYPGRVVILASVDSLQQGLAAPWRVLARGGAIVCSAPGDHESYSRRYFRETSEQLRLCLEKHTEAAHVD